MIKVKNNNVQGLCGFLSPEYGKRFDCQPQETILIPDELLWRATNNGFEVCKEIKEASEPVKPIENVPALPAKKVKK